MAKTSGKVTGVNPSGDTIATRNGALFTEAVVTSGDGGRLGNEATVSIRPDGSGRFELRVDGRTVRAFDWDASGAGGR